tara:strand:- start:2184 stop:3299 length:1116 start_codon:yes stop_codon:yes gene_type:complete
VCGKHSLEKIKGFEMFSRITSDTKIWPKGGSLFICSSCCCIQKGGDKKWHDELKEIYNNYNSYYQSEGKEQNVFQDNSVVPRSKKIISFLRGKVNLKKEGQLLDIGCGNGGLFESCNELLPAWELSGLEYNDKFKEKVLGIKNVKCFYTGDIQKITHKFDCISMVHLFEHILNPIEFLINLKNKLKKEGFILIEVPNFDKMPFDLLIADHASYFSMETLSYIINKAGYEILYISDEFINKEITAIIKKGEVVEPKIKVGFKLMEEKALRHLKWLDTLKNKAKNLCETENFGIFGTSNAGTWLCNELDGKVQFFVDEDSSRVGKSHLNCPVFSPSRAPKKSTIFLPFPYPIAVNIKNKFKDQLNMVTPENYT